MEQLSFFDNNINDLLPPGLLDYRPAMFDKKESNHLLQKFITEIPWQQRSMMMYGKEVLTPRLTAWYADPDIGFSVSGGESAPLPWTNELLAIRKKVEMAAGVAFNSVLLNYYRNGNDSVSWHDDEDGIPGKNSIVASVSLGAERTFDIRKREDHTVKYSILLQNGSYLLMKGNFQRDWQHRIAKSAKPMKERVNLTFRISNTQ